MKIKNPTGLLIASIIVASAAAAICVSVASDSSASTPVTPIDLGSPRAVQDVLEFDPFDSAEAPAPAGLAPDGAATGTGDEPAESGEAEPADAAEQAQEEAPGSEPGEDTPDETGAEEATSDGNADGPGDVQTGIVEGAKTAGKMKFGIGAAAIGAAGVAGIGGAAAAGIALDATSETVIRSTSTP